MKTNVIIVDDFYTNPLEVRQSALTHEFKVRGNYPGSRSVSVLNDSIKDTIQKIIQHAGGNIIDFPTDGYNGSFQTTYAWDRSWIHSDHFNNWAGVCYLTPDAPLSGGTGTFRHKATKCCERPDDMELSKRVEVDGSDVTCWEPVDLIGNKFNRLALFRGQSYHVSLDYFGQTLDTCRLFQVFFFSTEH